MGKDKLIKESKKKAPAAKKTPGVKKGKAVK